MAGGPSIHDAIEALAGAVDFRGDAAAEETVRGYLATGYDPDSVLVELAADRLNEHEAAITDHGKQLHELRAAIEAKGKGK